MQPPQVRIFYQSQGEAILKQVQYGLEEEGIPFSSMVREENSAVEQLAFAAAQHSPLGVGVGITKEQTAALHYYRLPADFPLFLLASPNPVAARALGSNAARLVKGNPFKCLQEVEEERIKEQEDWKELITRVVYRILQEGVVK